MLTMATSEDKIKYGVESFSRKNFSLWCRCVEAVFAAKDLDKYLLNEADDTKVVEVKESKKAYALLLTLLDDKVLVAMSGEISAHQIWKKLKTTYTKDGAVNQIIIWKRLATMKKSRDCTMQQHINELLGIVNDLRLCVADVKDMDVVVYLLMSLPPKYDVIRAAIENQPSENLNFDFVSQRLIDAETLMLDKNSLKGNSFNKNVPVACDNTAFGALKRDIVIFAKEKVTMLNSVEGNQPVILADEPVISKGTVKINKKQIPG